MVYEESNQPAGQPPQHNDTQVELQHRLLFRKKVLAMKKMMMLAMTALTVAVSNAPALVGAATTETEPVTATAFVHSAHVPVAMY